jgi:hypothetical protein
MAEAGILSGATRSGEKLLDRIAAAAEAAHGSRRPAPAL